MFRSSTFFLVLFVVVRNSSCQSSFNPATAQPFNVYGNLERLEPQDINGDTVYLSIYDILFVHYFFLAGSSSQS